MELSVKKSALSLGLTFGIVHLAGVLLIVLSAGSYAEWSMQIHHIKFAATYIPLNIGNLVLGTIVAAVVGAIIGALFATIWNKLED